MLKLSPCSKNQGLNFFYYFMNTVKNVHVITYCNNLDLLYGSLLVFETIKKGFPNSTIIISENNSLPEAKIEISKVAKDLNAKYIEVPPGYSHTTLIENIIDCETEPFAIVDPDVIFWNRFDSVSESSLIEGRYIPAFKDPYSKCITHERLHTSLLKISNPIALKALIKEIKSVFFDWDPFKPIMYFENETWKRFDGFASLCALTKNYLHSFTEEELNCYDHLFCGSHITLVADHMGEWKNLFLDSHKHAKNKNYIKLKQIWKEQDKFFNSLKVVL